MRQTSKAPLLYQLRFNLKYLLPLILQGTFKRKPFWSSFFARHHGDPMGVEFERRLRARCHSSHIWMRMLTKKSLFVYSEESIERILTLSPAVYAEPGSKRRGMGYFMPGAVTISRGREWAERRRLNENALSLSQNPRLTRWAERAVHHALERRPVSLEPMLRWVWFERVFQDIALDVIFGPPGRNGSAVSHDLRVLMLKANRFVFLRKGKRFRRFFAGLEALLLKADEESLAGVIRREEVTGRTRAVQQIPHWLFAIQDTLAENVMRAMALIAVQAECADRVREHGRGAGEDDGRFVEGCLQEAMRLYPTTPLLVREVVGSDVLGDSVVGSGDQVVIPSMMLHRNRALAENPDRFDPDRWRRRPRDFRFNHLSNGTQDCPGKALALFIGRTFLAEMFGGYAVQLVRPTLDASQPPPGALDVFTMAFRASASEPTETERKTQ